MMFVLDTYYTHDVDSVIIITFYKYKMRNQPSTKKAINLNHGLYGKK